MQVPSFFALALFWSLCQCHAEAPPTPAHHTGTLDASASSPASTTGDVLLTGAGLDALAPTSAPDPIAESLPDAPQAKTASASATTPQTADAAPKQTKRILFIIPNFRSVTADEKLPPTTTRQKFKLMLQDTLDYSAFAETAALSGMGEIQTSEPSFHGGFPGYLRYYWHSYADLADGNIMTEFLFPVATHEDPRYYTLGHGGFSRRTLYAVDRLVITRNNQGNPTPNLSEVVGNGAASSIASLYYPSVDRDWTKIGQRWLLQVGIDGLSNVIKEFWPEVNRDLFHGKY